MIGKDVPIMHGLVGITTIALLQAGLERMINKNKKLEVFMEGKADLLMNNGIIVTEALTYNNLSHADLFRILRSKDLKHLGEIDKAFFETSGQITIWFHFKQHISKGLSLMPEEELPAGALLTSPMTTVSKGTSSCTNCGYTLHLANDTALKSCAYCKKDTWIFHDMIE